MRLIEKIFSVSYFDEAYTKKVWAGIDFIDAAATLALRVRHARFWVVPVDGEFAAVLYAGGSYTPSFRFFKNEEDARQEVWRMARDWWPGQPIEKVKG